MKRTTHPARLAAAVIAIACLAPATAVRAFEPFALQVPCRATAVNSVGTTRPCITCHDNADGGSGCATPPCFNAFGAAFNMNGRVWNATLAALDSDGDGYTNGEELGDPDGTWTIGEPSPATCDCATRPGFAAFTPGDADADADGYCCAGRDDDGDGDCLDAGEWDGVELDCDDAERTVNTGQMEVCTNTIDNDCNGLPTLVDPACESIVDRDGDGYCPMGQDQNRDGDCLDGGEMTDDVDCDDEQPTVSPALSEYCQDGLDNDCNGSVDLADAYCRGDLDADGDGYCPIGHDANGNGRCDDPGEGDAGFDCDDSEAAAHPDASEICDDGRDNDCDGFVDFRDAVDCGSFFDADADGYCPAGRDGNGNGQCLDAGEDAEPGDCDDTNPAVNPGMAEVCTDASVDADCDGLPGVDDPDCAGYIDVDGDTYCFVGADTNADGFCTSTGEQGGRGDCDEARDDVHPAAAEICTDGIDNDCNGTADAADRITCGDFRDHDGDGFCYVGHDDDGDGDCDGPGEQGEPREWRGAEDPHDPEDGTEHDPTRYPGAPEHCANGKDEDLDGRIDEAEYCRDDVDADGDGWCPIGRDDNGDGDCTDPGENVAAYDCNDMSDAVQPGQPERCFERIDADCDNRVGTDDSDCHSLLDRDGDGVCGMGVDDNGDGDCLDDGEQRFGVDCDDREPTVNSRRSEVCGDGVDNDCNGDVDVADRACDCESDVECDDGDPCTADACGADGECASTPLVACGDGGVPDGGMGIAGDDCNCRAAGAGGGAPPVAWILGALGALLWRRRRRGGASACR